jgi:hypothetical protein
MSQQVAHDWNVIITKRKNAADVTVYTIHAEGSCSDPASSIQSEKLTKGLTTDVTFAGGMTMVQLRDAIEAALITAARG